MDDPLSRTIISSSGAQPWPAYTRCSLAALCFLLTLLTCLYVLRRRRRLPALCGVRVLLCCCVLLWLASSLAARRSVWDLVLAPLGVPLLEEGGFELLCAMHSVLDYGIFEPAALTLICLVFHAKSRASAATPWRPWRLVRFAFAAALAVALLQTAFVVVDHFGFVDAVYLGPQPRLVQAAPSLPPAPPPAAPPLTLASAATRSDAGSGAAGRLDDADEEEPSQQPQLPPPPPTPPTPPHLPDTFDAHSWWRSEGCAATYGAVGVTALFTLVFECAWTYACLRLAKTLINHKMRRRLRSVQLAFTLAPMLLLLLRAALLFIPATWPTSRRFARDVELLIILLAALTATHMLICRPVLEAAPVLGGGCGRSGGGGRSSPLHVSASSDAHRRTATSASRWRRWAGLRGGLPRQGSELGAAISVQAISIEQLQQHALASPPAQQASSGRLVMLGRHSKSAKLQPTLSVAVDLCADSSRRNEEALELADVQLQQPMEPPQPPAAAPPQPQALEPQALQPQAQPPTPARIASRLLRARSKLRMSRSASLTGASCAACPACAACATASDGSSDPAVPAVASSESATDVVATDLAAVDVTATGAAAGGDESQDPAAAAAVHAAAAAGPAAQLAPPHRVRACSWRGSSKASTNASL